MPHTFTMKRARRMYRAECTHAVVVTHEDGTTTTALKRRPHAPRFRRWIRERYQELAAGLSSSPKLRRIVFGP